MQQTLSLREESLKIGGEYVAAVLEHVGVDVREPLERAGVFAQLVGRVPAFHRLLYVEALAAEVR